MIWIQSISVDGGFLEDAPLAFKPGLNCIIGARGTCKSTAIETLRFLLGAGTRDRLQELVRQPSTNGDDNSQVGVVAATLGGATAQCTMADTLTEDQWTVERDVDSPAPRLFSDGVRELELSSQKLQIEVYSQGDLQRIAQHRRLRLALIDAPIKEEVERLRNEATQVANKIAALGQPIRTLMTELEVRRTEIKAIPSLQAQLAEIQTARPTVPPVLQAEREKFQLRKAHFELLQARVASLCDALHSYVLTSEGAADIVTGLDTVRANNLGGLDPLLDLLVRFEELRRATLTEAGALRKVDPQGLLEQLKQFYFAQNSEYYRLAKEEQTLHESLKKEDALRKSLERLTFLKKEHADKSLELTELRAQRSALRALLSRHLDDIYALRLEQVDRANAKHGSMVVLSLRQGVATKEYYQALLDTLGRSSLRNQADIARDLALHITLEELTDFVETGDAQTLADKLDRDLGQMARLTSFLAERPDFYDLEALLPEDDLDITFFDGGTPKSINQLSKGQVATALLPLILRPAPYPLIFDQPEDDLDNKSIFTSLVQDILELKEQRQLIFVTHNANIPVLGEAEQIVVMSMKEPRKAAAPLTGTVDERKEDILSLLEGGKQAFAKRRQRYGPLVDDVK